MQTVHQTEKFEIGEGASVLIRGMTAGEANAFATASNSGDQYNQDAAMREALKVVSGGAGFIRLKPNGKTEEVPTAEINGSWLMDNLPLPVCGIIVRRINTLSGLDIAEKKDNKIPGSRS